MAGFAGFINYTYRRENTELVLKRMTDKLIRRGTDIEAYYDDRYTHIGYRSKQIQKIELKKRAMTLEKGEDEYVIVFDGKLFNQEELVAFLKSSGVDTSLNEDEEIILNLYSELGEKFIEKLEGVFSFAIWNRKSKKLYMARDTFGIKPLYYAQIGDNLVFASEVKSILEFPEMQACITNYGIANMLLNGVIELEKKIFFRYIYELKARRVFKV